MMPRPEYYNLRRTDFRQIQIEAIAKRLQLDATESASWGVIIDFALAFCHSQLDHNTKKIEDLLEGGLEWAEKYVGWNI